MLPTTMSSLHRCEACWSVMKLKMTSHKRVPSWSFRVRQTSAPCTAQSTHPPNTRRISHNPPLRIYNGRPRYVARSPPPFLSSNPHPPILNAHPTNASPPIATQSKKYPPSSTSSRNRPRPSSAQPSTNTSHPTPRSRILFAAHGADRILGGWSSGRIAGIRL